MAGMRLPSARPAASPLDRIAMKISWAVLLRRIAFPTRSKASSFVIHPSGALTVFVLRDDHERVL